MKKIILLLTGGILTALGLIGIVVPVLPTTPFLLLAAACFSVSSPKIYQWLLSSRFPGCYIRHYREGTGVSLAAKIWTLVFLYAMLGLSIYLIAKIWATVLLSVVAIAVTVHVLLIRPRKPKHRREENGMIEKRSKIESITEENKRDKK